MQAAPQNGVHLSICKFEGGNRCQNKQSNVKVKKMVGSQPSPLNGSFLIQISSDVFTFFTSVFVFKERLAN